MIRQTALRIYSRFLFWKWDREYRAAEQRMRGCAHTRTMFVDVGTIHKKCIDCWALRVQVFDGSMEWTPNSARPVIKP